jgi:hypothetical protein
VLVLVLVLVLVVVVVLVLALVQCGGQATSVGTRRQPLTERAPEKRATEGV